MIQTATLTCVLNIGTCKRWSVSTGLVEILGFGSKIQGTHMEFWRNGRYLRAAPASRRMAAPARGAAPARREKFGISRPLECNSTVFSVIQTHVVVLVDVVTVGGYA